MTKRAYFGTDGIRGQANRYPMTAEVALRVGMAAGKLFMSKDDRRHLVVIGKDTRLSGYMIEPALVAGFTSVGMDVRLFGPLPTPGVAMMTRSLRADLGVMISASHNPFQDNGIKLFGPDGYKLSDETESKIEDLLDSDLGKHLAKSDDLGRAKRIDGVQDRYIEFAKLTLPKAVSFEGLRVVIDCANGAAYKVAPGTLWELGAEVVPIGVSPNGLNINEDCGSTKPQLLQETVVASGADIGLALDGDADRLIMVDEKGRLVDGDQLMALIALVLQARGELSGNAVVATVMSNLGLERKLAEAGLKLLRTKVGDRYVLEEMRRSGCNIGGEQSGHIILADHSTTGDGLVAALQVLAALVEAKAPAEETVPSERTVQLHETPVQPSAVRSDNVQVRTPSTASDASLRRPTLATDRAVLSANQKPSARRPTGGELTKQTPPAAASVAAPIPAPVQVASVPQIRPDQLLELGSKAPRGRLIRHGFEPSVLIGKTPSITRGAQRLVFVVLAVFIAGVMVGDQRAPYKREIEQFAASRFPGDWVSINKAELGMGSPTPNPCNHWPSQRTHWFMMRDGT
jgi:phosphoglucosamine mutase